jgi:hypothetical protein
LSADSARRSSPEAQAFRRSLVLTVVDKLVIGLLIVLAGFVLNMTLERFKSHQAFEKEIARVRVDRIGEVWSALYREEALIGQLTTVTAKVDPTTAYGEVVDTGKLGAEAKRLADEAARESDRTERLLEENRFWIGERLYREYRAYYDREDAAVSFCLHVFDHDDPAKLAAITNDIRRRQHDLRAARIDVLAVIDEML